MCASSMRSIRRSRTATIFRSSRPSLAVTDEVGLSSRFAKNGARDVEHRIVPASRANTILELIGNTPLLEITRLTHGLLPPKVRIFAKLEGFNPGGSVKDRPARKMLEVGLASGELRAGKTVIDSTSGNTGIALAMVGAALGYPVELVMPGNVSKERKQVVAAFGAKAIFSDPLEGSDGAIRLCRTMLAEHPDRYFNADQYDNEATWL